MQTTVLIENAVVLVVIGMSLHKSGKGVLLAMLIAALAHMAFDNSLLTHYNPAQSIADNVSYHWMTSLFFLAMFGLFMANGVKTTKLSFVMAGCMLAQSVLSFAVSINGAPISIVQIAGFVIGAGGLIVAVLRWGEARRTNNLAAEKWEHEKCQKLEHTESQTPKQQNK